MWYSTTVIHQIPSLITFLAHEPIAIERVLSHIRPHVCLDLYNACIYDGTFDLFCDLQAICEAYCNDTNPTRDPGTLDAVKDAILRMTYYW